MPSAEAEVEQPAGRAGAGSGDGSGIEGAAMEISVSRQDLVKELTATQSVVERKTTIPILSNFLLEADEDRLNITATDLDQAIRTSAQVKVKKRWLVHDPRAQALRLHQAAAGWRYLDQAAGESLGADQERPIEYEDGRHGARQLSAGARVSHDRGDQHFSCLAAHTDCTHHLRDLERGVTLHAQWCFAGSEGRVNGHGGDRRPPAFVCREARRDTGRASAAKSAC